MLKQKQETYITEDEEDAVDYCLRWKKEDACRFGNEEIGNFFIVQKNVPLGEGRCTPKVWL